MAGEKELSKGDERLIEEWPATALAGNDLMSSVLYTMGKGNESEQIPDLI